MVNTDDLIDAREVARLLVLSHPTSVSGYLQRYPDMPRPIVDLGGRRTRLWLRGEIEAWVLARRTAVAR
jgi:glutathione-regulated potassium-efflux system ancillary protein KefG